MPTSPEQPNIPDYSPEPEQEGLKTARAFAQEDKGVGEDSESGKQEVSEEKRREVQQAYENLKPLGEIQLGGTGFKTKILTPEDPRSAQISTLAFDANSKQVLINPDFALEKGLNEKQTAYTFCHEIGHFVQLIQDREGYLGTFERAREKAREHPEAVRQEVEKAWGTYFNIFLDIDDNMRTERAVPSLGTQRAGSRAPQARKSLYQDHLFAETDYQNLPRHLQFLYASIRRAMVPEEEVGLSDEVRERLDRPFNYLGNSYSNFQEFVNDKLADPDSDFTTILHRLRRTAEPIFEEFLKLDAEEDNLTAPEDAPQPAEAEGGMLDEQTAKEVAEEIKKAQRTSSEQAGDAAREKFQQEMLSAGFSKQEIERMEEIDERTSEIYWDLLDLWEVFLHTTYEPIWSMEEGYRSGKEVSVKQVIKQLPTLLENPSEAKVFKRRTAEQMQETIEPKKIDLHLILDLSASMDNDKREAVQEAAYAVAKSLIQFRRNMQVRTDGQSPFDIHLRITGFGSKVEELLPLSEEEERDRTFSDENPKELNKRFWQAIMGIQRLELGGTEDSKALGRANDWLSEQDTTEALESNQESAVVLEITDGETSTAEESRRLVQEMNEGDNVYTRGIKIPGAIWDETPPEQRKEQEQQRPEMVEDTGTFEQVWGKNGTQLDDLRDLREVMKKILFDALQKRAQ